MGREAGERASPSHSRSQVASAAAKGQTLNSSCRTQRSGDSASSVRQAPVIQVSSPVEVTARGTTGYAPEDLAPNDSTISNRRSASSQYDQQPDETAHAGHAPAGQGQSTLAPFLEPPADTLPTG